MPAVEPAVIALSGGVRQPFWQHARKTNLTSPVDCVDRTWKGKALEC